MPVTTAAVLEVVEPALVGRTGELVELVGAYDRARAGSPGVCLVGGDAGVGKTRLVAAFTRAAETRGGRVLVGGGIPVAEGELPFAPVIEAFRPVQDAPDLTAAGPVSPSAQPRMFELFLGALGRLARERPVVLVVEDLHWADRSTLNMLGYLARNLRTEPVLVVLTCRETDLDRTGPVRRWLTELPRVRPLLRIDLPPLTRAETRLQISALLRHEPDAALVDTVYARSEGNPLVTEALIASGAGEGGAIPASLRDFVVGRLAALPPYVLSVLRVAAVAGRQVRHGVLTTLSDLPEDDVLAALHCAVDQQILVPAADGTGYGFRHALIRDVVYDELLPVERRRLHGVLARVLEETPALRAADNATHTAEIAHHWYAAAEPRKALPAAVRAGLDAMDHYAFAEALHHLRRALTMWDQVAEPDDVTGRDRAAVEIAASKAAHLVGEETAALTLAHAALDRLLTAAQPQRTARLLNQIGGYHYAAGHRDQAAEAYRRALDMLPDPDPTPERAHATAGLARIHVAWSDLDVGHRLAAQAISVAEAARDRRVEGRARNVLGLALAHSGQLVDAVAELRRSLDIARAVDHPDDIALGYINTSHVLGLAGRYDEAAATSLEGYNEMRRLGLERQDGSFLQANAAENLLAAGRWDEAAQLLDQAEARGVRGSRAYPVLVYAARIRTGRGDFAGARERLSRMTKLIADGVVISWHRWYLEIVAETAVGEGRLSDARAAVRDGLTLLAGTDEERFAGTLVALGLRAEADAVERGRAHPFGTTVADAGDSALWLLDQIAGFRWDPLDPEAATLPDGVPTAHTCRAELNRLCGGNQPDAWRTAAESWLALGRPFPAGYAQFRAAEAMLQAGRPAAEASPLLRGAHRTACRLGAQPLRADCERLARWHRMDLTVAAPVPRPRSMQLLTARESEILALVTAGRTNREIADELFISPKTASVHVTNILRKLGVPRRTEAARIGHQLGLD